MSEKKSKKWYFIGLLILALLLAAIGMRNGLFGGSQSAMKSGASVPVKAAKVIKKDTPIKYEFVGQVAAKSEIKIMAKVSGKIVEKMVKGGDVVVKGQPLFRIDDKQYRSAVLASQAQVTQAQAAYSSAQMNANRYESLLDQDAIDHKTADDAISTARQNAASVEAYQAKLREAEQDVEDTLIVSPVDGRIDTNDLSVGSYVSAGSTTIASVSTTDPVWVQFSMSENEYLKFAQLGNGSLPEYLKKSLTLMLADGTEYPLQGYVEQIDKGVSTTTGSIMLKASFDNPNRLLLPGMFAKVVMKGNVQQGALLIPQKAVKEVLEQKFVTVVSAEGKAESRLVTIGNKVDNMYIVLDGITENDVIVVEGLDKLQEGTALNVTMIEPTELSSAKK